jgi:zinc transport system substrate-binding protein
MAEFTRRQVIASGVGTVATGTITGCLSDGSENAASAEDDGGSGNSTGTGSESSAGSLVATSSFFVFGDFAEKVVGDTAEAETLVPVGQHGHGWEPGPQIQGEVLESDVFFHGVEGFQPWADDLVESLRDDGADVRIVPVADGIELSDGSHDHDEEKDEHNGHESDEEHDEGDHDEHDENYEDEHEDRHSNEEEDGHDEGEEEDKHGHDHGSTDPHFWLDPERAKQAVGNISDAFAEVDDGNAEAYAENAEQYRSRLDELDEKYSTELGDAPKDVVFVAGHDAFGYLAERYGFEVETLTGLSPDDRPTPRDIEAAQEIIQEHNIEYVCADPLEDDTAANQLVEETDAVEVLPLTSIPGQTEEWEENGWGYIELMERLNLDTLKKALGAE